MTRRLASLARGTRKRWLQAAAAVAVVIAAAWGSSQLLERMVSPGAAPQNPDTPAAPAANVPHIIATLYYGTSDGQALAAVKREVPLGEGPRAQGRQILESELQAAPAPYLSLFPAGTMLRAFYITDRGDAFVNLSAEITTRHPGGSLHEVFTVYTIVNALTVNLPAITRVQILIGGKQADTLAGHVDLRRPFERDTSLVRETKGTQ